MSNSGLGSETSWQFDRSCIHIMSRDASETRMNDGVNVMFWITMWRHVQLVRIHWHTVMRRSYGNDAWQDIYDWTSAANGYALMPNICILLDVKAFRNRISRRDWCDLCDARHNGWDNIYTAAVRSSIYIWSRRTQTSVHHPWFESMLDSGAWVARWWNDSASWQSCMSVMCWSNSWGVMCICWWAALINQLLLLCNSFRLLWHLHACILLHQLRYNYIHITADYRIESGIIVALLFIVLLQNLHWKFTLLHI